MPKLNLDFSEVNAPTAKQIDFVQEIYNVLSKVSHIEMPEYTFEAYGEFISLWKDDYYETCNYLASDYYDGEYNGEEY